MYEAKNKIKKLTAYFLLFLLLFLAGSIWYEVYLPSQPGAKKKVEFPVEKGASLREIAAILQRENLIKSKFFFLAYTLLMGTNTTLKAGTYLLSPSMNTPRIVQKLSSGDIERKKITIIEGWTLEDIANYFEKEKLFNKETFFKIVGYPPAYCLRNPNLSSTAAVSLDFGFLKNKPEDVSLEGYLFPDTYEVDIVPGESEEQRAKRVVKMMLSNFDKKLTPQLREEIKRQKRNIHQILTMASLLEKEIKGYHQKQIAAGILWKRLEHNWPLQVDATLTYLTNRKSLQLLRKDKKINSPYNTYKYYGLPKGPICNPGFLSIQAAIYYEHSPNWYYLTTPDGKTIFSKTLQEHIAAARRYLK